MVKIEWSGGKNDMSNILTENVTGNITPGTNKIRNEEGRVRINAS
jgi:hypothetical protein